MIARTQGDGEGKKNQESVWFIVDSARTGLQGRRRARGVGTSDGRVGFARGAASASSGAGREAPTVDEDISGAARRWLTTARIS